jgi:broad specificity phosphatase PhoE
VLLGIAAPGLIQDRADSPPTIVLLVRHAEKAATPADDPPLTAEGAARAARLVHFARDAGVKAIYATQYLRTRQTVEPLATHLKIAVTQRPGADIDGLVAEIKGRPRGDVVLVAGHSNTIPEIIRKLGAPPVPAIAETEFDNLYIVTLPACGPAKALRLHLGEP